MKCLKLAFIQKSTKLCVACLFNIQKAYTSQKSRQFALRFYIQKDGHFALHNFHGISEISGGVGTFLHAKNNGLCVKFYMQRTVHFVLRFLIQKS